MSAPEATSVIKKAELPTVAAITASDLSAVTEEQWKGTKAFFEGYMFEGYDWSKLEMFNYDGFDPESVYRHLTLRFDVRKKKQEERWRLSGVAKAFGDSDKFDDFAVILNLFIQKGNLTVKNFKSFKANVGPILSNLVTDYALTPSLKLGDSDRSTAVTLQRVASAFPIQTCIVAKHKAKSFSGPFQTMDLPKYMMCQQFAAIIPLSRDEVTWVLKTASTLFACDQSYVINNKSWNYDNDAERKKARDEQGRFTEIAFNSSIIKDKQRCKAMQMFNVKQDFDVITKVLTINKFDDLPTKAKWEELCDAIYSSA